VCVVEDALSWTCGDEGCGSKEVGVGLLTELFERDRVIDRITQGLAVVACLLAWCGA
jgi:hypothetical protein